MISQVDYFRELVRVELIPRAVRLDASFEDKRKWVWECEFCGIRTPADDCPVAVMAKHDTFCKLRDASEIVE